MEFEKFLNRKLHPNDRTGKEKIHVVLVPTTPSKVASDLQNGFGDIVAMAVYITEERKRIADFVPLASSRHDVIVSGASAPGLAGPDDLSGKEVCVVKESLAGENLTALNKKFSSAKRVKINLFPADDNLEPEDILEMASAGLLQYAVVPSHLAQLWKNVLTDLKIYEDFPVTDKMESGWAVRKDSPKLRILLEEFARSQREGTASGRAAFLARTEMDSDTSSAVISIGGIDARISSPCSRSFPVSALSRALLANDSCTPSRVPTTRSPCTSFCAVRLGVA